MKIYEVSEQKWKEFLTNILTDSIVYAPLEKEEAVDYEKITEEKIDSIYYDGNAPITPLKAFYLPVKENVVNYKEPEQRVVIGVPNCDLTALDLLDNIYLDEEFTDPCYKQNREQTVIFGKDCYQQKESCHCTAYQLAPYPEKNCDVSMSLNDNTFYLRAVSDKGAKFLERFGIAENQASDTLPEKIDEKRQAIINSLKEQNKTLPDEKVSRKGIEKENRELWKKYSEDCVSCGACSFICPTCHCFLLIDKRSFQKIRNWDVCQFPAFAKVAAGEDPLRKLPERFNFRYYCKYSYKPDMFKAIACTGCGRCIDTCIGKIDKNEVITEACKLS